MGSGSKPQNPWLTLRVGLQWSGVLTIENVSKRFRAGNFGVRDQSAGTIASLRAVPRLRENYVWWKLGSTLLLSLLFCASSFAIALSRRPFAILAFLGGILFVATTATARGHGQPENLHRRLSLLLVSGR